MSYNPNPDNHGWVVCRDRLLLTLSRWKRKDGKAIRATYLIECPAAPRYASSYKAKEDRAVTLTFTAGDHVDRVVTVDRFERPVDNLWALAVGLDAIRLNEQRGLDDVARQVYLALPAPKGRDPWEVLGLRPDADEETIKAVFTSKARRLHPDTAPDGGDPAKFEELKAAYDAVRGVK